MGTCDGGDSGATTSRGLSLVCSCRHPFAPPTPILAIKRIIRTRPSTKKAINEANPKSDQIRTKRLRRNGPYFQHLSSYSIYHILLHMPNFSVSFRTIVIFLTIDSFSLLIWWNIARVYDSNRSGNCKSKWFDAHDKFYYHTCQVKIFRQQSFRV